MRDHGVRSFPLSINDNSMKRFKSTTAAASTLLFFNGNSIIVFYWFPGLSALFVNALIEREKKMQQLRREGTTAAHDRLRINCHRRIRCYFTHEEFSAQLEQNSLWRLYCFSLKYLFLEMVISSIPL